MRILVTSDWQCSLTNLPRNRVALEQLCSVALQYRVAHVLHLGDWVEHRNPLDVRVANFLVEAVRAINQICPLITLRGNHDSITAQKDEPSCMPVLAAAGAGVVSALPESITLSQPCTYPVFAHCVPYMRDRNEQQAALLEAQNLARSRPDATNILFFHNEVEKARYGNRTVGVGALPWTALGWGLFNACIGGHIHNQQHVGGNIWYCGSPFCCDWGEANDTKGFLLLEVKRNGTVGVTPILSALPGWYDPALPNFKAPKSYTDCRVRITVPIKQDGPTEIAVARARAEREYPGALLHIVPEFTGNAQPATVDMRGTDEEVIKRYLDTLKLPNTVTPEQVLAYLRRVLPAGGVFGVQALKFESVVAENVLCYDKVELDLATPGLVLVTGRNEDWASGGRSNGAGKSALLSLFLIALFGRTPKGQQHDAWAYRYNIAPAHIKLTARLSDGTALRIERGRRPAYLRLYHGDKEITMGDANATQRLLEQITNLTWDVVTNSLYVGQREIGSVFGTEKARKELFSRLLGMARFLVAQEALSKRRTELARQLEFTASELHAVEAAHAEAQQHAEGVERELKVHIAVTPNSAAFVVEKQALEKQIVQLKSERANADVALKENQQAYEASFDNRIQAEVNADNARTQLEKAAAVRGHCPVCGTKLDGQRLEQYTNELEASVKKFEGQYNFYEARCNHNRREREKMAAAYQENTRAIERAAARLAAIERELETARQHAAVTARLTENLEQIRKRIDSWSAHQAAHTGALEYWNEHKAFLELCAHIVGRDGLPAYLCSIVAPQLNHAAAYYSAAFTEGEIGLRFEIAGGDIDVIVTNQHGGDALEDQSGGEMRMAALISAFAIRDVLILTPLLMLDEPGDGLDPINAAAFARGLPAVVERFGTVFLVTHSIDMLNALEPTRHMETVKQGRISKVSTL